MSEKKNKYPWETLDTDSLYNPIEIITYHLYRHEQTKGKNTKEAQTDLILAKSYLKAEKMKELGVSRCFQRR